MTSSVVASASASLVDMDAATMWNSSILERESRFYSQSNRAAFKGVICLSHIVLSAVCFLSFDHNGAFIVPS